MTNPFVVSIVSHIPAGWRLALVQVEGQASSLLAVDLGGEASPS